MFGFPGRLPSFRTSLLTAILLLMFAMSSACGSPTDSDSECEYDEETNECR